MRRLIVLCLWMGVACAVGRAQEEQRSAPDASVGAALRTLASQAHDVFAGQVESITRRGGVVEVKLRVDASVVGSQAGSFVLREWAGLWPPGQQRYWIGERAMFFLRSANAAGLSTPVDDAEGVVPVVVQGTNQQPLVDVRRLDARVQRAVGAPLVRADAAAISFADAKVLAAGWQAPQWREPVRAPLPVTLRPLPVLPAGVVQADPVRSLTARVAMGVNDAQ
jgi:hypothetical protein